MRVKEILGLPIVDPLAARKIGVTVDVLIDPAHGELAGVEFEPRDPRERGRVLGHQVQRVGRHAVMLRERYEGALAGPLAPVDDWLDTGALVGLEVIGDDGDAIGKLADAHFDQDTLRIESYILGARGWWRWFGSRNLIKPDRVFSCSRELMVLRTGRVAQESLRPGELTVAPRTSGVGMLELPASAEEHPVESPVQRRAS